MQAFKNIADKRSHSRRSGFTLVELLIVIVVIAVLAAIALVSYNGIQHRAQVSSTKSDLKSIGTTIQLYQAEEGVYPKNNTELLDALGRQPDVLYLGVTNTGSAASDKPKSFMYCYSNDGSSIWVVAWKPVTTRKIPIPNGTPIYWWSNGGLGEGEYNEIGGSSGLSLCTTASSGTYSSFVWSYSTTLLQP